MEAIEFLKNKGITKATCYTDSSKTYYVNELAELMEEYAALRQPPVVGRSEQLPCPHCGQLELCAGNSPETCYHPKVC